MIRFDKERFDNFEDYLYNVYSLLNLKFVSILNKHPELNDKRMSEIAEICPEVYKAFRKACDFENFTKEYLGYIYLEDEYRFKYVGE